MMWRPQNSKAIKDADGRSQNGIEQASLKAKEADQHATDADTRAQAAQLSATQTTAHLSNVERVVGNLDQYKSGSQPRLTSARGRPF